VIWPFLKNLQKYKSERLFNLLTYYVIYNYIHQLLDPDLSKIRIVMPYIYFVRFI